MQTGTHPPTLADIIKLDWVILQLSKKVRMTQRSIANQGSESVEAYEQAQILTNLQRDLNQLILKREDLREALLNPK